MTLRDEIEQELMKNYHPARSIVSNRRNIANDIIALIQPRFDEIKKEAIGIMDTSPSGLSKYRAARKIKRLSTLDEPDEEMDYETALEILIKKSKQDIIKYAKEVKESENK